jgi:hypothetical protein
MFQPRISSTVTLRSLPLLAILVLAPALARGDDFSFGDSGGCSDPPITSQIFTLPPTNGNGGMCLDFGNHSGTPFTSLKFTTSIPDADIANPSTNPRLCSGGPFFTTCDFVVDTLDDTITVEFFGLDSSHHGIPVIPPGIDRNPNNFEINLNNPVCDPLTGICTQPTSTNNGTGDWVTNGTADVFTGAANGVPEATTLALLLGGIGALLARSRFQRNSRVR